MAGCDVHTHVGTGRSTRAREKFGIGLLAALLIPLITAQPAKPQQACEIQFLRDASLGNETNAPVSTPMALTRHGDRYLLTHVAAQGEVLLFDTTGHYLGQLGRTGSGPGEFRSVIRIIPWRGDSVGIWDPGNGRVAIYEDLASEPRYARLTGVRDAVILDDGRIVANTQVMSVPEMALHTLRSDGEVAASYDDVAYPRDQPWWYRRSLVKAVDGNVWAARQTEYRLDLRSPTGKVLKSIVHDPPWFPGPTRYGLSPEDPTQAPEPGLIDVAMDDHGLLILIFHVADPRWKTTLSQRPGLYGRPEIAITDQDVFLDTIVEVVDPTTGDVVASHKVDQALLGFGDAQHAYAEEMTGVDQFVIQLWKIKHTCGG